MMQAQTDYVLRTVEERGVRFVRLWFTDVLGFLKSFAITPAELEGALEEGMTFDGSAIEGYTRVQEADMLAKPDPGTFEIVPWRGDDAPVARMFCDVHRLDGEPFEGDPRTCSSATSSAREKGFTFYVGPEMEFFYFRSQRNPEPLDEASYFDLTQLDMVSELRKQTILTLEAMGIPVEYSFHELGPSQHEIDLRYTDALTMADNVMTFRLVVKEVAQVLGVYATFMPKPLAHAFGSGMHTHLSLFEGDQRLHDPGDSAGLSKSVRTSSPASASCSAITAVTNQWVNSSALRSTVSADRRLRGADVRVSRNNCSALVRAAGEEGEEDSTRIESAPDGATPTGVQPDAGGGLGASTGL
jgi:glutamine synthetase